MNQDLICQPWNTQTCQQPTTQQPPHSFANVRVFDGHRIIEADSLIMRDGMIAALGVALESPPGAQVVDGTGCTLLPGLIDSHVHAQRLDNLTQALAFGVTTVLDMFRPPPHLNQTARRSRATR
ncbi:MAG: hypothetical protein ACRDUV_17605 [Pseudonocardiaceae bacterium]